MTHVQIEHLTKKFKAQTRPAVNDISLEIDRGEIVALLGPSGCGKTTTLKMIAGLLTPHSGDIRFDGVSILSLPPEKRNAVMVFQQHALFPFMSVGNNVAFGLRARGVAKSEISTRVKEMLDLVQLPGMEDRSPDELSGGQQQRIALARALIIKPRVLLLDEPLANLDAHLRDEMRSLILSIQKKTGVTTIVVTHDQEEAVLLANRIALMFEGKIMHFGPAMDLFQRPRSEREARFFGGKNFLPAVREGTIAHTPLGDFHLDPSLAEKMPDGDAILTIRSEHITIGRTEKTSNTIAGKLSSCIFLGTHTRCMVSCGEYEFEALKNVDSVLLGEGDVLKLHFPAEHIWLFPRG